MPTLARFAFLLLLLLLNTISFGIVDAQYPHSSQDGVTTIQSPINSNITVSYKSPPFGTCTTVFRTQKQYTGYVHLPPNVLEPSQGNYSINSFFWFIEARQLPETAPLTIFINGGPGSSSMIGLFQELGPCKVVQIDRDTLGTVAREWGWDRASNMLFIDQPVQVGFSYDVLTNMSLNLLDETLVASPMDVPASQPPYTFLNGTFSSSNGATTANTTRIAAESVWHFLQSFLAVFPQYNPGIRPDGSGDGGVGINLFTESYGGKFGPAISAYFTEQNERRLAPSSMNSTLPIKLNSLGIINGWLDSLVQTPFFPRFAYSNTYSIQAMSQVQQINALGAWNSEGGCQQLTSTCRAQQAKLDPNDEGENDLVNVACSAAQVSCQEDVIGPFFASGRSVYDISQNFLDPFPDSLYLEYLNQADVQQAIGVPVNYTQDSLTVYGSFLETGDYARNGVLQDLVGLLEDGVRVALIYGDRDFICNWYGGEAASFAIANAAGPSYAPWYSAGYTPIVTNESYIGGVVREFGNLSFARIYDAGHLVPAYQPETAFTVFARIIEGNGVSLGMPVDLSTWTTTGEGNATHTNEVPDAAGPTCYLRAMNATCDRDQKNMIANRAGTIINGVLYSDDAAWQTPDGSVSSIAGRPTVPPSSALISAPPVTSSSVPSQISSQGSRSSTTTSIPTGVFTATGVPSTAVSNSAARDKEPLGDLFKLVWAAPLLGQLGYETVVYALS